MNMKLKSFLLIVGWVCVSVPKVELVPIVGGQIVKSPSIHTVKYPYMVSLQEMRESNCKNGQALSYQHFCGGSLVNSYWILTAAHCLFRKDITRIAASIGRENITNVGSSDLYGVKRIEYIYFEPTNLQNDIALLRLQTPYLKLACSSSIPYAKLPLDAEANVSVHGPCKIMGYGAKQHAGVIQNNLYEGEVSIISKEQCRKVLGRIWAPQNGENTICALGNNQDTCQGDSGGPLICNYNGRDVVYGIVSHGLTCGISGIPSIYTVTIPYVEWIQLVIKN